MEILAKKLNDLIKEYSESLLNTEIEWNLKPGPNKWSGKEILGHLIDSANNNIQRFVRGTYESDFKIIYHQDKWVEAQKYQMVDTKELITLWTLLNKQIVRIWENYPIERTTIKSDIGQQSSEVKTMYQISEGYIEHLIHHLTQVNKFI